jgi:hypothetical protein
MVSSRFFSEMSGMGYFTTVDIKEHKGDQVDSASARSSRSLTFSSMPHFRK